MRSMYFWGAVIFYLTVTSLGTVQLSEVFRSRRQAGRQPSLEASTQQQDDQLKIRRRHDIPKTSFSCKDKQLGEYYADPETNCRVYHVCLAGGNGHLEPMGFKCPDGTLFSQATRVCSRADNVYCAIATQYYENLHGDRNVRRNDYGDPSAQLEFVSKLGPLPELYASDDYDYQFNRRKRLEGQSTNRRKVKRRKLRRRPHSQTYGTAPKITSPTVAPAPAFQPPAPTLPSTLPPRRYNPPPFRHQTPSNPSVFASTVKPTLPPFNSPVRSDTSSLNPASRPQSPPFSPSVRSNTHPLNPPSRSQSLSRNPPSSSNISPLNPASRPQPPPFNPSATSNASPLDPASRPQSPSFNPLVRSNTSPSNPETRPQSPPFNYPARSNTSPSNPETRPQSPPFNPPDRSNELSVNPVTRPNPPPFNPPNSVNPSPLDIDTRPNLPSTNIPNSALSSSPVRSNYPVLNHPTLPSPIELENPPSIPSEPTSVSNFQPPARSPSARNSRVRKHRRRQRLRTLNQVDSSNVADNQVPAFVRESTSDSSSDSNDSSLRSLGGLQDPKALRLLEQLDGFSLPNLESSLLDSNFPILPQDPVNIPPLPQINRQQNPTALDRNQNVPRQPSASVENIQSERLDTARNHFNGQTIKNNPLRPRPGSQSEITSTSFQSSRIGTSTEQYDLDYNYEFNYRSDGDETATSTVRSTVTRGRRVKRISGARPLLPSEVDTERSQVTTNFQCDDKIPGDIYADMETDCEMFHICIPLKKGKLSDYRLFCANGTAFNQETGICEEKGTFDCTKATQFFSYDKNRRYFSGKKPLKPKAMKSVFQKSYQRGRVRRQIEDDAPSYSYNDLPKTSFTCIGKSLGGYYADPETECQLFHICAPGENGRPMDLKFLCTNGTVFNQVTLVCERYGDTNCEQSSKYYNNAFTHLLDQERLRKEEEAIAQFQTDVDIPRAGQINTGYVQQVNLQSQQQNIQAEDLRSSTRDSRAQQRRKKQRRISENDYTSLSGNL
ncbi:uncharacterized protein LOC143226461 [Tachypleus tridentatus]|uniref:uncharacterized protein LOC143226461 n=1 Tax=Tachypleus tridentatus TaxID=6853 RepID=UPI003FD153D3